MNKYWKLVCTTYFQIGVNIIGLPEIISHKQYEPDKQYLKEKAYHN